MQFTKFVSLSVFLLLLQNITSAQEWTSYQSPNQINDLLDTGSELMLATDEGLVIVDKATLETTTLNTSNSSLSNDHIQVITQSQAGGIWIGTYDVVMLQLEDTDFRSASTPNHEAFNENTQLYDFELAANGDLWVATDDGVFHKSGDNWEHYGEEAFGPDFFESWDIEISAAGEIFAAGREVHQFVAGEWVNISEGSLFQGYLDANLFTSSTGDLYIAGDLDGIGRYDGETWQDSPIDFNGSEVNQFTEDPDGNVYFISRRNGIFKLEGDTWVIQEDIQTDVVGGIVHYFHIDAQGKKWINNNIHLTVNDNGNLRSTLIAEHTLESNAVKDVYKGENGKMYFISWFRDNISVLDTEGNWSFLASPPTEPFESINDLLVLQDNDTWLTSQRGLYHYDGTEWTFDELGPCGSIKTDSQGKMYVKLIDKILIIDNGTRSEYTPANSSLTALPVSGMGIDANDNLWLASGSFDASNVIQTVTPNGEWTTYTTEEHPTIKRPVGNFSFADNGDVWIINEPFGALKFDGTTWTDPIQETEIGVLTERDVSAVTTNTDGKVYFAHEYGISTLMDGEWENFINEEVITNNTAGTTIEFDDAGTLWWANGRTGVFSFMPQPTTSSTSLSEAATSFKVFPNPAQAYTTLDFTTQESAEVAVAIYNQLGQLATSFNLGQRPAGDYREEVNLAGLAAGFYTLQLRINNGYATTKLVIH